MWNLDKHALMLYNSVGYVTDCIHSIASESFITTSENATIELWNNNKNKPIFTLPNAHSADFICSVAGIKGTDLLASGSTDSLVNIYKVNEETIEIIDKMLLPGSINGMKFADKGEILVCAQSVDQRLGRWQTRTTVPIGISIIRNELIH